VGSRLKHFRVQAGLTQEQLAEAEGITFQQIQKYENGTNRIAASRLYSFTKILGIKADDFFKGYSQHKND
jgi:transcriptional regulator with XRE-family HTH domain